MGISKMQGTPWHIETLKSNGPRRNKKMCEYYRRKGYCAHYYRDCTGSQYCSAYSVKKTKADKFNIGLEFSQKNKIKKVKKQKLVRFKVKYIEDNEVETYIIGKNIKKDAPLTKEVDKREINEIIEINGTKIMILDKNNKILENEN